MPFWKSLVNWILNLSHEIVTLQWKTKFHSCKISHKLADKKIYIVPKVYSNKVYYQTMIKKYITTDNIGEYIYNIKS